MADDQVKDWDGWNKKWQRIITAQSPYEWNFAQKVIRKVPGLNPNDVTPQQSFTGNDDGIERHMDFAIKVDGVKIAIEVEGWDKTDKNQGKNKREHDEFNRRIQSLESQQWRVLTVTNKQFMTDPAHYANHIRQLILQGSKAPQSDSSSTTEDVEETEDQEEPKEAEQVPNEERTAKPLYVLVALAAIVVIGVVIWSITRDSDPTTLATLDTVEEAPAAEDSTAPESPSAFDVREMYILKNGKDIETFVDRETGQLDCPMLGDDAKPVFLPDPENDPHDLDGDDNGWGCTVGFPAPIYYTKNFEENGNSWFFEFKKENGNMDCSDVPSEAKPIHLNDPEDDPHDLDGNGNKVDDGVACFP